jgi:hypothetical protein
MRTTKVLVGMGAAGNEKLDFNQPPRPPLILDPRP